MFGSNTLRAERRVARRLLDAGAISPETAQVFEGWRWSESRRLARLLERGLVHRTAAGALYIDEAAWTPYCARRRKLAYVPGAVLLSLMIVVTAWHRFFPSPEAQITARVVEYDEFVRTMNADGVARLFTEDGEMWNAGTLVKHGPDAIGAYLHSFDGKVRVESQQTTVSRIVVTGDRVTVYGTYRQTARLLSDNSVVTVTGEIQSIWVPCEESSWCIKRVETTPK